jgi:hypothetical protein
MKAKTMMSHEADYSSLFGAHINKLRVRGDEFRGCCPFHEDHSPSWNDNRTDLNEEEEEAPRKKGEHEIAHSSQEQALYTEAILTESPEHEQQAAREPFGTEQCPACPEVLNDGPYERVALLHAQSQAIIGGEAIPGLQREVYDEEERDQPGGGGESHAPAYPSFIAYGQGSSFSQ